MFTKEVVVENLIVQFAMFMFISHHCNSRIYKLQHFVASFDTLCSFLNIGSAEICACNINRLQKIIYVLTKTLSEITFYVFNGYRKTPNHITVFLEKQQGIVITLVLFDLLAWHNQTTSLRRFASQIPHFHRFGTQEPLLFPCP